ncbi:MAG: hypothetical protein A2Y41_10335 [Spirochaetes bacterium GWB1_36_13]|nr:MAG: hypothetical protein A2Y41_10335 [Spirochaetes bacterium GWB1_36_13]
MKLKGFNDWKIFLKILTLFLINVLIFIGFVFFYYLPEFKKSLLKEKETAVKQTIEMVYTLMAEYYDRFKSGELTEAEAKKRAVLRIKSIRYDKTNYIWINDMDIKMVMHPIQPALDGKDLSDMKDPSGKRLFYEFTEIAKKQGAGFSNYLWPKPGEKEPILKLSYIKLFKEWDWVVGTGIYIDDVDKQISEKTFIIVLTLAIVALLVFMLVFIIAKRITRYIKPLIQLADEIAKGNLNENKIQIASKDELGILAVSFNKMMEGLKYKLSIIEKIAEGNGDFTIEVELASENDLFGKAIAKMLDSLNQILGQVNATAEQMAEASNHVSDASQSLSTGAAEQASSLEEITSSAVEINSQAKQNAENAIQAKALADKAKINAEEGNGQMKELIVGMSEINQSSEEIKKIIKVIDDIAFQINLLALNANVEAARAGKYGKGFAVVAEEVRNLAVKSATAVKETTKMVEKSIGNINKGNNLVQVTATKLDEITVDILKAADLVSEITAASREQSAGLDQISTGLNQIEQVTQTVSASAEQSAAASEELASQAVQLKGMIQRFKLKKEKTVQIEKKETSQISPEIFAMLKKMVEEEMNSEKEE